MEVKGLRTEMPGFCWRIDVGVKGHGKWAQGRPLFLALGKFTVSVD